MQGVSFLGPAACLAGCAWLTPTGVKHTAGVLSGGGTALIVALLSASFALSSWARGGLYCNHQVGSNSSHENRLSKSATYVDNVLLLQKVQEHSS